MRDEKSAAPLKRCCGLFCKYGRKEQEWLYREYVDAFSRLSDLKMYDELKAIVEEVFSEGRK